MLLATAGCQRHDPGPAEAALKTTLKILRKAIDDFYIDNGKYPGSLQALVEAGYLKAIPPDPITRRADWLVVRQEDSPDEGIVDVRSSATALARAGVPYGDW